jgi:hypothetical protein
VARVAPARLSLDGATECLLEPLEDAYRTATAMVSTAGLARRASTPGSTLSWPIFDYGLSVVRSATFVCDAEDVACGPPLLSWVESHYCVPDYGALAGYLFENHGLFPVLMELWSEVRSHFGAAVTVMLELSRDEEAPELCRLYAIIVTALSSTEALAQLDALYESWWLDNMAVTAGALNIGIRHLV